MKTKRKKTKARPMTKLVLKNGVVIHVPPGVSFAITMEGPGGGGGSGKPVARGKGDGTSKVYTHF